MSRLVNKSHRPCTLRHILVRDGFSGGTRTVAYDAPKRSNIPPPVAVVGIFTHVMIKDTLDNSPISYLDY